MWTLIIQCSEIKCTLFWFSFLKICLTKFLGVPLSNAGVAITVDFTIMLLYKWENKFFKIEDWDTIF